MAKVVLLAAIMDLCHEGHLNLLKEMRATGRKVVVVLHDDKSCYQIKGKIPIQNLKQRIDNLRITGLVDWVIVTYSTDPHKEFAKVCKHNDVIYMRGDDLKDFPGKWILDKYSIPIIYKPYTKGISSTSIRKGLNDR